MRDLDGLLRYGQPVGAAGTNPNDYNTKYQTRYGCLSNGSKSKAPS